MEEDWGLQAIVRACSHDQYTANSVLDCNYRDDLFYDFPDFEELKNNDGSLTVDELDDLYKPFCDPTAICSLLPQLEHLDSLGHEVKSEQECMKVLELNESVAVTKPAAITPAAKYKRKNQQKRVVVQVTAEGLSSDLWAWRKYGQKPIKGSPHPRSYYRCSSSKGCLARRQVEQSCTDPGMFIITYSAEHNHTQPTRRSSLAGTNRLKFSTSKRTCSGESRVLSSTTKLVKVAGEEPAVKKIKEEKKDRTLDDIDEELRGQGICSDDHEFVIPDSIHKGFLNPQDLVYLDGLISSSSFYGCSSQ
ncbi:hypothetical protein AgCh_033676 [Apium graveolens]